MASQSSWWGSNTSFGRHGGVFLVSVRFYLFVAAALLSSGDVVNALRSERVAESQVLDRQEFPTARHNAAATFVGPSVPSLGGLGGWGGNVVGGSFAGLPVLGQVAQSPPLRAAQVGVFWGSHDGEADEKNAIKTLPRKWNLEVLQVLAKRRHSMLFAGIHHQGEDKKVTLKYFHPVTEKQASQVKSIIAQINHNHGLDEAGTALCDGFEVHNSDRDHSHHSVQPGAHVHVLMEGAVGTLEEVLKSEQWKNSFEKTRYRLFWEMVLGSQKRPLGTHIRPSDVVIVGDLDDQQSWHAVLLRDLLDDDEHPVSDKELIRELGEIGSQMSFHNTMAAELAHDMVSDPGAHEMNILDISLRLHMHVHALGDLEFYPRSIRRIYEDEHDADAFE